MAVEELAAASGLSAGTVVHHLKRLEAAGLVQGTPRHPYVEYSLRVDRLQAVSKELAGLERADEAGDRLPGPTGESLPRLRRQGPARLLRDGRLVSIPAQERKRQGSCATCSTTASREDRVYPEREVNECLGEYHEDVASLRRYLVPRAYDAPAASTAARAEPTPSTREHPARSNSIGSSGRRTSARPVASSSASAGSLTHINRRVCVADPDDPGLGRLHPDAACYGHGEAWRSGVDRERDPGAFWRLAVMVFM